MTDEEIIAKYEHLFNNTGGNKPEDLLHELKTNDNLARTNIVVFGLAICVRSQVDLLKAMHREGLL